jgi:outer membrane protein assembly factor BamB
MTIRTTIFLALATVCGPAFAQTELFKLTASDAQANDFFGSSIVATDQFIAVGMRHDDDYTGAVYVFDALTGNQIHKLTASDAAPSSGFGYSVDADGEILVVGTWGAHNPAPNVSGKAYVFNLSTGQEIGNLVPTGPPNIYSFGNDVAVSGDTVLVGAPGWSTGHCFVFNATTGQQLSYFTGSDVLGDDRFGEAVSLHNNLAVVGMVPGGAQPGQIQRQGAAYLFDVSGTPNELHKLTAGDSQRSHSLFGYKLDIDQDTVAVAALFDEENGAHSGAVYLFSVNTGQQTHKLLSPIGHPEDRFGSVSVEGQFCLVGSQQSYNFPPPLGERTGKCFLFDTSTGALIRGISASDGEFEDYFGDGVHLRGNKAFVTSHGDHVQGVRTGSAYVYDWTEDCNANGVPDHQDLTSSTSSDCDSDFVPDECQISDNPLLDLDQNGVIDTCECLVYTYCTASPNTVGPGARIGMSGSPLISTNNLVLLADDCPTNQFGIFYYGPNQIEASFGSGVRCVGGATRRLPVVDSGSLGVAAYYLDILNQPTHPHQISPGSTWNFQYWYRDPSDGGAGFNLSNGLSVTFCD